MTLLKIDEHLVREDASRVAFRTHQGQAYFGGTGPAGKSCKDCLLLNKSPRSTKYGNCSKYSELMNGDPAPQIPLSAHACKYFEQGA